MEVLKPKSVKIAPDLHERAVTVAKHIGFSYNKFVATAMEDHIVMIESPRPVIPQMVMMAKAAREYHKSPPLLAYPKVHAKKKKKR